MTIERAIQILKMNEQAKWRSGITYEEEKEAVDMAIEALKERPHGEWEQVGEMTYKCTKCGLLKKTGLMPFCENCGADMRKEGEAE